jgi:manganese transport protein
MGRDDTLRKKMPPSIEKKRSMIGELLKFLGPGFLVTIGFIDPGNWATNMAGGADFRYNLLWVITLSTLMLILIQNMSARLGITTGKSLAANIREHLPTSASVLIGVTIVIACAATDVAELLGGAIGFNLLLGMPLWAGALLTVILEVFFIVSQRYHRLEKIILGFLGIITICFIIELFIVEPDWLELGPAIVIPHISQQNIYIAMGMLGAVVMPHNIFLHSNVIQSRKWGVNQQEKKRLIRFERIDTLTAMGVGWLVNSSMIIVAASVFHRHGVPVGSLEQASAMLRPLAGPFSGFLFSLALLAAGISSSTTSSMAEVNVITAFLGKPEDPKTLLYKISTFITAIPSFVIILLKIDTFKILIFSQVVLSMQLPFTLVPLLILCRKRTIMGDFRSKSVELVLAIVVAAIVIVLNLYLLYSTLFSKGGQ